MVYGKIVSESKKRNPSGFPSTQNTQYSPYGVYFEIITPRKYRVKYCPLLKENNGNQHFQD